MDKPAAREQTSATRTAAGVVNPKIGPMITGMAPPPPPEEIPEFSSKTEEIVYWERKLQVATRALNDRSTFVDRLNRISSDAEDSQERELIESRRAAVERNYESARTKVKTIEKRLEELRG